MAQGLIKIDNLNMSYGKTRALKNINLKLPSNSFVGLLGRKGQELGQLISKQLPHAIYIILPIIAITELTLLTMLCMAISFAHHPRIQKNHMGLSSIFFIGIYVAFSLIQGTTKSLITHKINIGLEGVMVTLISDPTPPSSFTVPLNSLIWSITLCLFGLFCIKHMLTKKLVVVH